MKQWTITIPDVHPSLNKWTNMHYSKRGKLKKEWEHMVWVLWKEKKYKHIEGEVEVFITYYHPRNTVDLDNYTPKFIMDGLKIFFEDDSIKYVTKLGWEILKGEKCSVVTVTQR